MLDPNKFILSWCVQSTDNRKSTDFFVVYTDFDQARDHYAHLLEREDTYTATLAVAILSTD